MKAQGVVREWHDEGWGVIDSEATPGGCWAHFSAVRIADFVQPAGVPVEFTYEAAEQDGYAFRALELWLAGEEPYRDHVVEVQGSSPAYRSTLRFTFDDE